MILIDDLLLGVPFLVSAFFAASRAKDEASGRTFVTLGAGGPTPVPDVPSCRAAVPQEPGLKHTDAMLGGWFYSGHDADHLAYLDGYLANRAASEPGEAHRGVLAFQAIQRREGSTAAVNTYDNQLVTLGSGWGGLGGLPRVMDALSQDPQFSAALAACGLKYLGQGNWSVVDDSGSVVTGKKEALRVIRATRPLLDLFVHLAKDPATRDAVTDAQLDAFLATSGNIPGSETIATQALYNFAAHLKHWAPGYMQGTLQEAAAAVPGDPSPERDAELAPAIVSGFYARAHGWVPDWKQLQGYVRDMKADGLDVTGDPLLSASSHPAAGTKVGGASSTAKTSGGSAQYPLWVLLDNNYAPEGAPFDRTNAQHWYAYTHLSPLQVKFDIHSREPDLFLPDVVVAWYLDPAQPQRGALRLGPAYAWQELPDITPFGAAFGTVVGKPVDPYDWDRGIDKTAGGCSTYDYPNWDVCGSWGPFADAYLNVGGDQATEVKVVGGPAVNLVAPARGGFRSLGFHHPWYRGQSPRWSHVLLEPPYAFAVQLEDDGALTCAGVLSEQYPGGAGTVCSTDGAPVGFAGPTDAGYALLPPGFEGAYEVQQEPELAPPQTAGGPGDPGGAPVFEGWGEVRTAGGPGLPDPTPDQVAVIQRGILPAVQDGSVEAPTWTQVSVQGYDLMLMNEPLAVGGLRLPTNQDELYKIAALTGTVPITPAIAEARWQFAARRQVQPSGQVTGGKGELLNDPGQVVRANAALGPNQGVLTDGGWKELVVVPGLQPSGRGAMAQYGYRNADATMFEHEGPSNHDEHYKGASDTPTYVSRKALKNGVQVDLLDEYAAGGPLGGPLPAWMIARLRGPGEVGA